ncbi:acetyl-coenzyme a transporter 1 protein [Stemphylium lycopersici]|uniref:Acetyl-coenzyme a transporter 1 protein n=1 Tax=Stemphylium lycopersici TaxID=183478 RepID=A0A364MWT5_STELY|nr:acetyl-coenzyme a transporter 1 protein [Stemphylium lycopersici]RAR00690.1 acetyl-coenzyme a transporter 1 protein [Stemphylium lycopersici]RAR05538.1 acetyl-coenzyme a transporter 1 protein [Stemphylium lycopersici]
MSKRASRPKNRGSEKNGDANTSATMNGVMLEHRRKHNSFDSSSPSSQAASLMGNSNFSLDDEVPKLGEEDEDGPSKGFFELSKKDQSNFLLLVLLYFLQGIPMGLAHGSVPFLLKHNVSYAAIGVFSLAAYPYSLKLLWSPIVDAVWSPTVGRRKSWILPIQTISGFSMIWLGKNINRMMKEAGETDSGVWTFTWWWFALVFLCATQDIAVDGWALTLLSKENLAYASTAQTVGLTAGQFLSYTVFLAFNSKDFANRWFRSTPAETGLMELDGYLSFWGWAYLVVTFGLAVMKREDRDRNGDGIGEVYRIMWGILKLKNIQSFVIIHLIAKIGFQANDAVTSLKLLDKGLLQEQLSLVILVDFPVEVFLGYYIGKWCQTYPPMHIWCWSFMGRLVAAGFAQFVVSIFPTGGASTGFLMLVIAEHVLSTFMNTVMFVAVSAFHAKISDPLIGGTYMTLLATVSNLGGTFPRYFVLKAVDMFTSATCIPPADTPKADLKGPLVTQAFSCSVEAEKHRCIDGGGLCNVTTDGYYVVNILCIIIGVVTFWGYIKPAVMRIQALPLKAWRIAA